MDIVLVGGGGHCKAVIDVLETTRAWRIAGVVEARGSRVSNVLGYPVIGYDDELDELHRHCRHALVTVGQIKTPEIRMQLFTKLVGTGFTPPPIISPLAHVARDAVIGAGSIVMHFAQIGPGARVGANTIVNSRALVEHDATVGNHCHVSTGAILNGDVTVGDGSMIGSGATCREGITIGQRCVIAMGALVRKPVPDGVLYFGDFPQ